MSKILKVINKYETQLNNKLGGSTDIFFYKKGRLNIDESVFLFFKQRINEISLEDYNHDLQLNIEDLYLGFYNEVVWKYFIVFDELGIYMLSANNFKDDNGEYDNLLQIIYWDDVKSVELEDAKGGKPTIHFNIKEGDNHDVFYNIVNEHGLKGYFFGAYSYKACQLIVQLINDIIEEKRKGLVEKMEELNILLNDEQYNQALEKVELLNRNNYSEVHIYYQYRIWAFIGLDEASKSLNEVNIYKGFFDKKKLVYNYDLISLLGIAYRMNGDPLNAIKWYTYFLYGSEIPLENKTDDEIADIESDLRECYNEIKKEFVDIPLHKRKFIFMSDQLQHCDMEGLVVLKTNDAPESLKFPLSHPKLNEVYMCHPIKNRSYIPIKDYQKELFVDKLREFMLLMDALGATKIDVVKKNKNINNNQNTSEKNIGVGASYKGIGGNVDYKKEENSEDQLEQELNISFHQILKPKKAPYLPEGLVWFHTDLYWQGIALQRMNGGLTSDRVTISTKQIESLSSHELKKVNVELNILFAKANVDYQNDIFSKSSSEHHYDLEVLVEFEDIDNLKQVHSNSERTLLDNNIDSNKKADLDKYSEDIKFMLEDAGIICEIGRRMLNRKREKYGLTIKQAEQIEKEIMFNPNELNYIEEYKMFLEDGNIGEMERKMLERYAKRYNIDGDRQKILEKSIEKI